MIVKQPHSNTVGRADGSLRAILLDFYGTVVHDDDMLIAEMCDRIAAASPLSVTLAQVGAYWWRSFSQLCVESYGPAFRTQKTLERLSLQDVLGHCSAELDADALSATLYEYWARPPIYEESVDVLSRCGVPICLVSNIDNRELRSALVHHGLHFEHVVTSQDCRAYKPRGEMFDRALALIGLSPDRALHVGDSQGTGVRGARRAGIPVLWVNRRGRPVPEADAGPDYVSSDLNGLLDVVDVASPQLALVEVTSEAQLAHVRALFIQYVEWLNIDLAFQHFEEELAALPGAYAPPSGLLLLATYGVRVAGCAALRQIKGDICEMKRLYVRPGFRGKGIGKALANAIVARARALGYARVRLDTLPWMDAAIVLYRSLGFGEIEPYRYNPIPGARFLELAL